jgi:nucleotide-binding universal stress UspA family protein
MFQQILVPLDGSPRAEQALPVAARIARFTGGSLLLVQVVNSPLDASGGWSTASFVSQDIIDNEMSSVTTYLQALATSPAIAGIDIRTEVGFGLPVPQLLGFAKTSGVDLIVLCSHGRTGFTRWMLGSVAHKLVHECKLPLLVLHQGETAALAPGPLRTLVPLDGSLFAEAALRPAAAVTAALATSGQGVLHLSQVVTTSPGTGKEGVKSLFNAGPLHHANIYLSQVEERLSKDQDLQVELTHSVELASDVASALLTLAENGQSAETGENEQASPPCDLIALSTHGRGGLERWLIGSVAERLLNTTQLSLLIVRPPQEGEGTEGREAAGE